MTLHERALAVTPGGAQTRSKRATVLPFTTPGFLVGGSGAEVYDTEGHRYVDWICGLAAISLGYANPDVDQAVAAQMRRGVSFSLPTQVEIETAELVCDALGAEQVRFVKTGSEATEGAMRIARLATGRDTIISIGYHGWHSMHDAASPAPTGVPEVLTNVVLNHPWGLPINANLWNARDVAAVLVEPCRDEPPPAGYLEGLRTWCDRHGALLIFDEVVTGFRWALRGASEMFGVEPDLRCYGKGMANGYPLACIVGPAALMQHATYVSGTFGGECLSLAAAAATIRVFQDEPVIKTMWEVGQHLMDSFNALHLGDLQMVGYPCHPRIVGQGRLDFVARAAQHGVLFHPAGFNVSYAHGPDEVARTIEACEAAQ